MFYQNKLAIKTNDASSASRQLELAISDFNLKEQQLKDKYSSKVFVSFFFRFINKEK